jgi:hypothetical protein
MGAATNPSKKASNNGHHRPLPHEPRFGFTAPLDTVSDGEPAPVPKPDAKDKPQEGRTASGTFAPGNKFARGNPNARKMAVLRSALVASLTPERMKALGERLYTAALAGNLVAMKLLLTYAVGRPPDAVNADRLDQEEWDILGRSPTFAQLLNAIAEHCSPGWAAEIYQMMLPATLEAFRAKVLASAPTPGPQHL